MSELAQLSRDMYAFSELYARGIRERLHFWLTGKQLAVALAVRSSPGAKLAVRLPPWVSLDDAVRRLSLFCGVLVVAHDRMLPPDPMMLLELPPDFSSPRIGVRAAYHPRPGAEPPPRTPHAEARERLPPYPEEQEEGELASRGTAGNTSAIARFTDCPYPESTYSWLFGEARPLIEAGRVAFAPFLTPPAGLRGKRLAIDSPTVASCDALRSALADGESGSRDPGPVLWQLRLPYIENVPLITLGKIMTDHQEELGRFQAAVMEAYSQASATTDPAAASAVASRIQKEVIDDGISQLESMAKALKRRRWFRNAGCVIAGVTFEIIGLATGAVPPGTGLVPTFGSWALGAFGRKAFEQHPVHFLWRLRGHAGSRTTQQDLRSWTVPWLYDFIAATGHFGQDEPHGLVCVTANGTRFHYPTCRHLTGGAIPMRIGLAQLHGYRPCARCLGKT